MGRLIPVFEDNEGRMLFQGKFKDEDSGRRGYLEVGPLSHDSNVTTQTEIFFVSTAKEKS